MNINTEATTTGRMSCTEQHTSNVPKANKAPVVVHEVGHIKLPPWSKMRSSVRMESIVTVESNKKE